MGSGEKGRARTSVRRCFVDDSFVLQTAMRLMGLILAALAVGFITSGLAVKFPGLED